MKGVHGSSFLFRYASLSLLGGLLLWAGLPLAAEAQGEPEFLFQGQMAYERYCASCHGTTGKGDGPQAKRLRSRPTDLTDGFQMTQLTDEDLLDNIRQGKLKRGGPPSVPHSFSGLIRDEEVRAIIAYIRASFSPSLSAPFPSR